MVAPWRSTFLEHISLGDLPSFTLATVAANGKTPRGRTCVFRGMWGCKHGVQDARTKKNMLIQDGAVTNGSESVPNSEIVSDCFVFTTDRRSEKVVELWCGDGRPEKLKDDDIINTDDHHQQLDQTNIHHRSNTSASTTESNLNQAELVFWMPNTQFQWRLRGAVHYFSSDQSQAPDVKKMIEKRMFVVTTDTNHVKDDNTSSRLYQNLYQMRQQNAPVGWSWQVEIDAHFAHLSDLMRGSFRSPLHALIDSSTPTTDDQIKCERELSTSHMPSSKSSHKMKKSSFPIRDPPGRPLTANFLPNITAEHDYESRKNFLVGIVVPHFVEALDLGDGTVSNKWIWNWVQDDDDQTPSGHWVSHSST